MKSFKNLNKLQKLLKDKNIFLFPFNLKSLELQSRLNKMNNLKFKGYLDNYRKSKNNKIFRITKKLDNYKNVFVICEKEYLNSFKQQICKFKKTKSFFFGGNPSTKMKEKINLDKISIKERNLNKLFIRFNTDKANFFIENKTKIKSHYFDSGCSCKEIGNKTKVKSHNYAKYYIKHFNRLKNKRLNILEIGVAKGGSTAAFYNFFKNSNFYCIDLNKDIFEYYSKKIFFFKINYLNSNKVKAFALNYKNFFDIIIDDGSHASSHILLNLKNFTNCLKKSGIFVIEDFAWDEKFIYKNDSPNEKKITEILQNIRKKKFFKSKIIDKKTQKILFKRFNEVKIHKGSWVMNKKNISDIAFLG